MQQLPEARGLLGDLCPGQKRLDGKSFYLDGVKSRSSALLVEAISLLGGRVESFLHKDVSFVVTGSRESPKEQSGVVTKAGTKATKEETHRPTKQRESFLSNTDKPRAGTPRPMGCGSRGKALLEKAIRNNERLQGSSVLANAQSWGVKILYVDDVLSYLKQLTRESFSAKHKRTERTHSKQQASLVKASALRSPYLKVEDSSRKYKPLHTQSMTFPSLCYSSRHSPFELPPPLEKLTRQGENKSREKSKATNSIQDDAHTPLSCNPSPWRPRRKDLAYCECCHQPFTHLEEHLQSDQHRQFVLDSSNYSVVDQLVAAMLPGFDLDPSQGEHKNISPAPSPSQDTSIGELEPLTDAETEDAVQALLIQGSSFNTRVPNPTMSLFASGPASSLPAIQFLTPNPTSPLADSQHFTPNTDCQLPDRQPCASSPAVPSLDAVSLTPCSASQQSDTQHLSPCPDVQCQPPDPYDLPPVLSPQVLDPYQIMEPHSPYSEPPVLSPQQYIEDEAMEGHTDESETLDIVSQSVPAVTFPISTPLISAIGETSAEVLKERSKQPVHLSGFSGLMCSNSGLECTKPALCRSCSLPRPSVTTWNPKKRCRSASPEHNPNKKRRTSMAFGHSASSASWTEKGHECFAKSQSAKGCLLFEVSCTDGACSHTDSMLTIEQGGHESLQQDLTLIPKTAMQVLPTSSVCSVETLGSKDTFCFPTVQIFNQIDFGLGSTSIAFQPSWPSSLKASVPPSQLPNDKPLSAVSSQYCQPSPSHAVSSVCIESALIPDFAALSPSSSESDWDCEMLSRLCPTPAAPLPTAEQSCALDKEILQRPCTWMHDTSYESHLHTVLQPATPAASLCGEEMDSSAFSRTLMQIVEVQH